MLKFTIGIIRESKVPPDNRVPLTPRQCHEMVLQFPHLDIRIEWSPVRCFSDEDYKKFGIGVQEKVDHCSLLMGIKEVPIEKLIPGQTYMFFSHTAKKQERNKGMLKAIIDKKITLIDYELLTDESEHRLIGFGRWAGIVGTHYALLMLGKRSGQFELKTARQCLNLQELVDQYYEMEFPVAKFVITGGGRVAHGALEIMEQAGIQRVTKEDFLAKTFDKPVFVQLHSRDLYSRKDGKPFDEHHFYHNPSKYNSTFQTFHSKTDILVNCMFWDPRAPRLFEIEDTKSKDFSIKIISDITCDVDGSIPITLKETTSDDPVYGYHPEDNTIGKPYQEDTIDVMAISNLPNELPRDASRDFGKIMMEIVLPRIMEFPNDPMFIRATIVKNGELTDRFKYLEEWTKG
jgi:saccharopine dehydrogenase (NAD+, L-lysine forming)